MSENNPFIQIDIPEDGSHKHPYIPLCYAGEGDECKQFLAKHENDNYKKKFPFCCKPHKFMHDDVKKGLDRIIAEKTYDHRWWFDIENYKNLPLKIPYQIFLTTYHIDNKYDKPDGYNDITEYIDYIVDSLGQPAVFAEYYFHYLKEILQNSTGNEKELQTYKDLLNHIDETYFTPKEKVEVPDLNELFETYQKWLAAFPFNVSYFIELKKEFETGFFVLLLKDQKGNRYTNMFSAKARTQTELIEILTHTTKELLFKIDAVELLEKGQITDTKQHTLELLKKDLKIKNDLLLGKFLNGEIEYMNILKEWLSYQKDFFRDIAQFITNEPAFISEDQTPEKLKANFLKKGFKDIGFYDLPMIKGKLSEKNIDSFFELLSKKKTPYQIAMLHYLGVLDFLYTNNTKEKSYKILTTALKAKNRVVKGNCLVLSDQSKEDRTIYTSFIHIKEVEKDYQNIKLG